MTYEWDAVNLDHIARHNVSATEAEEVIENNPLDLEVQFLNGEERFPHLGETKTGRILFVVAISLQDTDITRVVTAFEPAKTLRDKYVVWKGKQYGTDIRDTGIS